MTNPMPERGLLTFEAEGNDISTSPWYSRKLHWPKGASGVTIGRGYDMKLRSKDDVEADLITKATTPGAGWFRASIVAPRRARSVARPPAAEGTGLRKNSPAMWTPLISYPRLRQELGSSR